jgi:hypothetical protein
MKLVASLSVLSLASSLAFAGTPFATHWITFDPGANPDLNYTDPASALGRPSRFTGDNATFNFPGAVTAFNGAYNFDQVLSIGTGGHIILAFDAPVLNDPEHHFGIDILVFGNASFIDADYPNGIVGGIFSEGGTVELSEDGVTWITATGVTPDGEIPTVGYSDLLDPFATTSGSDPSNFRLPVDPSVDFMGMTNAQALAAYNGSGGGTGLTLALTDSLASLSCALATAARTPSRLTPSPVHPLFPRRRALAPCGCGPCRREEAPRVSCGVRDRFQTRDAPR